MTDRILLAVDLSYQCYRASAAHPMLTSRDHFTGGLYGFFTTLAKQLRETRATELVICQDRKPYLRSTEYPDYKKIRKKNADETALAAHKESMTLILEILAGLGIPVWGLDGFESDDLIAHAVVKYRGRYTTIYAASNDSDLWQLLCYLNFHLYTSDIESVGKERQRLEELGLTPEQHSLMTAMTGTHNDIEGIPRCGPITATKAIKDPSLMRNFRCIYADVIDRNLRLIKLPHASLPWDTKIPVWDALFVERNLFRLMGRYDIEVTASMVRGFQQLKGDQ